MADIASDGALIFNVLTSVGVFLEEKTNGAVATPSALKDADDILKRCHETFAKIRCLIDKKENIDADGKRKVSKRAKLIWPTKSNKAELLKSSLMLLLKVLSLSKIGPAGMYLSVLCPTLLR